METKQIITPGLNVLPTGSLSIETNAYNGLIEHCKLCKLHPKHLYLYVNDGEIIAGFSTDISTHVKLHHSHWKPVFSG